MHIIINYPLPPSSPENGRASVRDIVLEPAWLASLSDRPALYRLHVVQGTIRSVLADGWGSLVGSRSLLDVLQLRVGQFHVIRLDEAVSRGRSKTV